MPRADVALLVLALAGTGCSSPKAADPETTRLEGRARDIVVGDAGKRLDGKRDRPAIVAHIAEELSRVRSEPAQAGDLPGVEEIEHYLEHNLHKMVKLGLLVADDG